jgi:CDP-glucose 4,6-dehydratase
VNITSDKCYENNERLWGYRESDPLGGHDPYSSSKACAELVTAAYRNSFFDAKSKRSVAIASARAGNVIGGGDFSKDRIVPDLMISHATGSTLKVRSPNAIRPWQHVLDPLAGYLLLAERLWDEPKHFSQSWNFGPRQEDMKPVRWIVESLADLLGGDLSWEIDARQQLHEANLLTLDSTKSQMLLGWRPRWSLEQALRSIVEWQKTYEARKAMRDTVLRQIENYEATS